MVNTFPKVCFSGRAVVHGWGWRVGLFMKLTADDFKQLFLEQLVFLAYHPDVSGTGAGVGETNCCLTIH